MKILVLGDYEEVYASSEAAARLIEYGSEITIVNHPVTPDEVVSFGRDADAIVLVRERTPLQDEVIKQLPHLKLVSQTGKGTAHLDTHSLKEHHIALTTTPSEARPSVNELTIGLMIGATRQFSLHQLSFQNEQWTQVPGMELRGKQLGILGLGSIGRQVAETARALGMKVKAFRPTGAINTEELNIETASLEEVLQTSDVISLHMRYSPEWKQFLNKDKLSLLKKGSVFINTARGKFVDEEALAGLLKSRYLLGAGIDVFTNEPLKNNPFKDCPNVILTPHIGYITVDVLKRFANSALTNVETHFFHT